MKILFIAPHLSTGGMPEYLRMQIESLSTAQGVEVWVVEYSEYSSTYTVQKESIIEMIGKDRFVSLGAFTSDLIEIESKKDKLVNLLQKENFDIIHIQSFSEDFDPFNKISYNLLDFIYNDSRKWRVVETSHNSRVYNKHTKKVYIPDGYIHCTPFYLSSDFERLNSITNSVLLEYPILNKTDKILDSPFDDNGVYNIVNVGLWSSHKNQGEVIRIARILEQLEPFKYQFHFIGNQSSGFAEYWEPLMTNLPSNCKVWLERNDVERFYKHGDLFIHLSTLELNPLVLKEAISYNNRIILNKLPVYGERYNNFVTYSTDNDYVNALKIIDVLKKPVKYNVDRITESLEQVNNTMTEFYKKLHLLPPTKSSAVLKSTGKIEIDLSDGITCHVRSVDEYEYYVKFSNYITGDVMYTSTLPASSWARPYFKYFYPWRVEVESNDPNFEKFDWKLDLSGKEVYIKFHSSSLGDTLAWIPIVEEFRKEHGCKVYCSTFKNDLLKKTYPQIKFVEPGESIRNLKEILHIYAVYNIGWFYENEKPDLSTIPTPFTDIPLQQTASDILGLPYKETPCFVSFNDSKITVPEERYITFSMHSTAQAKHWNNENGWQEVIDWLNSKGIKAVCVDKYRTFGNNGNYNQIPDGCDERIGLDLPDVAKLINSSELFIGLSSGLSWLSWALQKKVVMISGFSKPFTEFNNNCIRIAAKPDVCSGCFNEHTLDKHDWMWCPRLKGTDRQFECSKSIKSSEVIAILDKILFNE